jgi:hypothetical protein
MSAAEILVALPFITLIICSLAGNYYLTQIAFNAPRDKDGLVKYQISDAQYTLIRITSVMTWIVLVGGLFKKMPDISGKKSLA